MALNNLKDSMDAATTIDASWTANSTYDTRMEGSPNADLLNGYLNATGDLDSGSVMLASPSIVFLLV